MTARPDETTCVHEDFACLVEVNRLTDVEGGPVVGYSADIRIECAHCHEPFCFRGVPLGLSQFAPTGSFDGQTLTAPIHPMSDPTAGIGLLGFSVTEHTSDPHDPLDQFKERGR